ncbi:MAG TPA: response regulator [Oligoflexia bacterium]|nr:response regulator [Oligoflexia bacterium]
MDAQSRPTVTRLDDQRPEGPLILVAEDQAATRLMIKGILKQFGLSNVMMTSEGGETTRLLQTEKFDLIICDWHMPNVLGIDILRVVRRSEINGGAPFIMVTSETNAASVAAALDSGVTDYITKPFTAEILISKVQRALKAGKKGQTP